MMNAHPEGGWFLPGKVFALTLLPAVLIAFCGGERHQIPRSEQDVPVYSYRVVNTFPHDPAAYTQGLVFHEGSLLESTGLHGQSSLRQVELESGRILKRVDVPSKYFAEGDRRAGRQGFSTDVDLEQGVHLRPEELPGGRGGARRRRRLRVHVLNGIAYDAAADRLFVTGKRWPKIFEIQIKKRATQLSRSPGG